MSIVIGFLQFILVIVSFFLVLLVLVQLPKKEAGVGMAFGAGMSEMLLGAGSGNILTRITKYTVGIFLGLSLVLSVMISGQARKSGLGVSRAMEEQARSAPAPSAQPPASPAASQGLQPLQPMISVTNLGTATDATGAPALISTTIVVNPAAPAAPAAPATPTPVPTPNPGGN